MKKYFIPVAYIALCAAFFVVCALVYFNRGRQGRFIGWKMRLGGLLLMLSGMMSGCSTFPSGNIDCYLVDMEDSDIFYGGPTVSYTKSDSPVELVTNNALSPETKNNYNNNCYNLGISFFFPFKQENSQLGLIVNFLYSKHHLYTEETITSDSYAQKVIQNYIPGNSYPMKWSGSLDIYAYSLGAKCCFTPLVELPFNLDLGFTMDYLANIPYTEQLSISNSKDFKIRTDLPFRNISPAQDKATIYDGELSGTNKFVFKLDFGLSYSWSLPGFGIIRPFIYYNYALTGIQSEAQAKMNSFQIGVDVLFAMPYIF